VEEGRKGREGAEGEEGRDEIGGKEGHSGVISGQNPPSSSIHPNVVTIYKAKLLSNTVLRARFQTTR